MKTSGTATFDLGVVVSLSARVLEAIPAPTFVKDASSLYIWASRSWADLLGLEPGQIPGGRDGDFLPPDAARVQAELDLKALSSASPAHGQVSFAVAGAPESHLQMTVTPILAPDGRVAGLLGLARDAADPGATCGLHDNPDLDEKTISYWIRSLLMSHASASAVAGFLRHLGELNKVNSVAVYQNVISAERELEARRRYHWANPETDHTSKPSELLAYGPDLTRWYELLLTGSPVQGTLETIAAGERAVLAAEGLRSFLLLPLELKGQFWGFMRLGDSVHRRIWSGPELRMLAIGAQSLSAFLMRMQSEQALQRKIEEQGALWNSTPDSLYIKDRDSVYLAGNPAFADLVGMPCDKIPGKTDFDLMPPREASKFRSEDRQIIETGRPLSNIEDTFTTASGRTIQAITNKAPLRDASGAVVGIIGIVRDITEYAELERQVRTAQKMESIGTLAAGIAHDFNNVLTVILGFSQLVLPKLDEEGPLTSYVGRIVGAGERARDLVRQLLTFSRQVEAEKGPVFLAPILKETVKFLRSTLPSSIEIVSSIAEDAPCIQADPTQMHQVAMNLCVNAAHAMAEGGTLTVRLDEIERDEPPPADGAVPAKRRWLQLIVEDTGCGMDEAVKARIFEPFFTTKEPGMGTGLGLSTVYGIVKDSQGTIEVDSTPGVGTTFRVCFPITATRARCEAAPESALPQRGSETVLFVDDEPALVELGRASLEEAGYTVFTASDGAQALSLYEQHLNEIAVVVADTTMPRMGGPQLISHVLTLRPKAKVVLSSGQTIPEQHRRPVEQAGGAILMKPYVPADILTTVRRVLDA